jgi:hypothetical protein
MFMGSRLHALNKVLLEICKNMARDGGFVNPTLQQNLIQ